MLKEILDLLQDTLEVELERTEIKIDEARERLAGMPDGSLRIVRNGKYVKNVVLVEGEYRVIPKDNFEHAVELAAKEKLKEYLRRLTFDREILQNALHDLADFSELVVKNQDLLDEYARSYFESCSKVNENNSDLLYGTMSGVRVRSKSEAMSADHLKAHGLNFKYEVCLDVCGKVFHPDFAIYGDCGQVVYWEHFGMMDDPGYVQGAMRKLSMYVKEGFVIGQNLMVTFESKAAPLTTEMIEATIAIIKRMLN